MVKNQLVEKENEIKRCEEQMKDNPNPDILQASLEQKQAE